MEVVGLSDTIAAIQNVANGLINESKRQIKLAGQAYANDVKALSPYDTGTLRRSIHVEPVGLDGSQFYVLVGTDLPYARRLEYGFYDMTDSLGRHYYQYARPYFRPPLDRNMSKYVSIMKGGFDEWLSSQSQLTSISGTMRGDFGGSE